MSKYSVLSCIFSGYEMVREIANPNPDIEYIMVTDNPNLESETWKVLYYPALLDYPEGPDRWAYVRYHPFEFVNTDICLYIDGSVQIKEDPIEMLERFEHECWEYGTLQNTIVNDIRSEVHRWAHYGYYGFTKEDAERVVQYLDHIDYQSIGLLQSTIIIYKNTRLAKAINDHTWTTMFLWGKNGQVDRINQTTLTYAVYKMAYQDPRFVLMHNRFLFCKWFEYCYHNSSQSQREGFEPFINMTDNKAEIDNWMYYFQDKWTWAWVPEL